MSARLLPVAGIAAAVLLWWLGTTVLGAGNPILAHMGPIDAVSSLLTAAGQGWLWATIGASVFRLLLGLLIAAALGVGIGVLVGTSRVVEQLSATVIQFVRMISPLAWAPVAIMLFGIGTAPVVFLIVIAAVWPIVLATVAGIRALDARWWLLAETLGATKIEAIHTIALPGIRPHLVTGIRLALGVSWIVLVPAEMLGVDSGLGYQVLNARDQFDYSLLAGVMLLIGAIGFLMDVAARKLLGTR